MTTFISFNQAALKLKIHRATISRWSKEGVRTIGRERIRLAAIKRGSRYFTTTAALAQFLERCRAARWPDMLDSTANAAEELLKQQFDEQFGLSSSQMKEE